MKIKLFDDVRSKMVIFDGTEIESSICEETDCRRKVYQSGEWTYVLQDVLTENGTRQQTIIEPNKLPTQIMGGVSYLVLFAVCFWVLY